ncbi:energy transducer TonB [Hymenobacter sp. BT770]|uniref:energy transducer TonB n=1 Tax=Hymenobacter sp. BT770 TaxID=2886942 RepID=UPI001D116775|nr:energy transducer TonB [Hymenobacter sp. BT770]MCC3153408.1 energy transducer TonB [Hymenobacter sp. BT770]MDO3415510.1 energy transducer TonB [Hymenobacter sp. BT770]
MKSSLSVRFPKRAILAALLAAAALASPAAAQTTSPQEIPLKTIGRVYISVEQMPQLPTGGGNEAIIQTIQSSAAKSGMRFDKTAKGTVYATVTVGSDGQLRDARIVKALGGGTDEAVLAAVKKLPRLVPGRQAGQPVSVALSLPVPFPLPAATVSKGE